MKLPAEYLKTVAQTIFQQTSAGVPAQVFMSWGVSEPAYTQFNEWPALTFLVNGLIFKGRVFVVLDEGRDVYMVYLLKNGEKEPELVADDVFFDELGKVIDRHIEAGDNTEEYNKSIEKFLKETFQTAM